MGRWDGVGTGGMGRDGKTLWGDGKISRCRNKGNGKEGEEGGEDEKGEQMRRGRR